MFQSILSVRCCNVNGFIWYLAINTDFVHVPNLLSIACTNIKEMTQRRHVKVEQKAEKARSLDIAPLTILDSGALQPRKWQLTGNDCSTAAHAVAAQSPR